MEEEWYWPSEGGGGDGYGGGGGPRELDQTPTWAVASVCAVIVLISILLEKVLHRIGEWFTERRKKAMFEALEKVKTELMVLGFISLLLTFGQNYIAGICIPEKAASTMLPCPSIHNNMENKPNKGEEDRKEAEGHRRLLLSVVMNLSSKSYRILSEASPIPACPKGQAPLVSINALHQLHIFIFFLALLQVFFSAITMTLGRAKIRGWKEWERETTSADYEFSNDPARFRLTHETSFVRQHTSFWNKLSVSFYAVSFLRQFFRSVRKADYLAMRQGFISVHLSPGSKFDFQKYIKRALEDDFKVVVGIRAVVQFLCSYITLPLYALVSQMGSQMKKSIFDEETSKALKKWHQAAKKKNVKESVSSPTRISPETSPKANANQLLRLKSNGKSDNTEVASESKRQLDLLTGSPA